MFLVTMTLMDFKYITKNWLVILLIALAGVSNSFMDTLQFHYGNSIFADENQYTQEFWNPDVSWKNKWKNGNREQGEKFLGSSTLFVFTTDAWHLAQFFMLKFFFLAVLFFRKPEKWWEYIILFFIFQIAFSWSFEIFWSFVLVL